jgi:hypothetical protein
VLPRHSQPRKYHAPLCQATAAFWCCRISSLSTRCAIGRKLGGYGEVLVSKALAGSRRLTVGIYSQSGQKSAAGAGTVHGARGFPGRCVASEPMGSMGPMKPMSQDALPLMGEIALARRSHSCHFPTGCFCFCLGEPRQHPLCFVVLDHPTKPL